MYNWGVFNDEGLIDGPLHKDDAEAAARVYAKTGEDVTVARICDYHEEQQERNCELCNREED